MKNIIINKKEDFDKLRNLKGKDYIVLKISNQVNNSKIEAINLGDFQGTIDIRPENPRKKYQFHISTYDIKKTTGFFYASKKVTFLWAAHMTFNYHQKEISYKITTEKELEEIIKKRYSKVEITLLKDLVISKKLNIPKSIHINGNNHCIYANEELINTLKNKKNHKNIYCFKTDRVIKINTPHDFAKILEYPNESIVANLENDISDTIFYPLNLEQFYGTLIILGNDKWFKNIALENSMTNSLGIISDISVQANLIIKDLKIQKLVFPIASKENVGCLLGSRTESKSPYYTFPGKTLFQNCWIENVQMLKGSKTTGILAGKIDEFAENYNCGSKHILSSPPFHMPFGNQSYFTEETLSLASYDLNYQKRICIDNAPKRIKKK